MQAFDQSTHDQTAASPQHPLEDEKKQQILHELENILESRFFRSAGRSKQFLRFVVQHKLDGHSEPLKERTIGVEVFERPHDYATGDDPVVRVQAGEVRRRLHEYYQAAPTEPSVHIELPIGSYSPLFREGAPAVPLHTPPLHPPAPEPDAQKKKRRIIGRWAIVAMGSALALAIGITLLVLRRTAVRESAIDQFWKPAFATHQAVLICLAAPVVYRPTDALYKKYAITHPGTFQSELDRTNNLLPLDPHGTILWSDMWSYSGYGVVRGGDAYAAVALSGLLAKIGKPSQLRIGTNYSFADLRTSPAVVVGAFNNRWTMGITSSLRFVFVEQDGRFMIREQIQGGRVWEEHYDKKGEVIDDTAIVARLLDSRTGQFTIVVAGIGERGTQAAGEFVSNPELLGQGLRSVQAGWPTKNLEIVVQTAVTDLVPGPPRVVAAYCW
jgi:hypothetical protein